MAEKLGYTLDPIGDLVIVKEIKANETRSGVILPDTVIQRTTNPTGTVLFIGPDVKQIKVGDTVVGRIGAPNNTIAFGRDELYVIHECDLLAIKRSG